MSQRFFEGAQHALVYAQFRPTPPKQLGDRIISYLKENFHGPSNVCVDVGCGNGQSSSLFASEFGNVIATDISSAQISVAKTLNHPKNIQFIISPAEKIPTDSGSVQIVSSSQACHWFDLPTFYKEVDRVLCTNGVIALSGYALPTFVHPKKAKELSEALDQFYSVRTASFWGPGREHIDNEYANIEIPYKNRVREDVWSDETNVSLADFVGYLTTWSGYQSFCKQHGEEAGKGILDEFTNNVQKALSVDEDPNRVELTLKRKYFLLMGRKNV